MESNYDLGKENGQNNKKTIFPPLRTDNGTQRNSLIAGFYH